ncbi:hypothetical protein NLX86_06565 [Streptomyces sp. A3M-1-3]|uniref:hypothetical protein n=1 Tax=Streptomyces sp. A3M-1-3 TaxID=2962044 RepID=UPI0020B67C51|nr:hypothetical protein [Streptomyces sp. A3M-1-3]MCP3817809.1 hypothetical protein [Streptomyces sp. A3M-1-3]
MAGRASRQTSSSPQPCPACSAPTLTQLVGRTAALNITADLTPLTPEQQAEARTPNRLIWCLYQAGPHNPPRLRWTGHHHPPNCPHPHVTEHHCRPAEQSALF